MPVTVNTIFVVSRFLSLIFSSYSYAADFQPMELALGTATHQYAVGALPSVNFQMPTSWAGQIPIPGTANDELFFWLFQAEKPSNDLIIWLNGGPGCSSLDGLTKENGPISFPGASDIPTANPYSWTKLANVLYIDQPLGTGYSSGSDSVTVNSQVTQDFVAWLKAFYDVFPSLIPMTTHITGESYAGIYIPYFTQALLQGKDILPINISSITIGDGTIGNLAAQSDLSVGTFLHQQANFLKIPQSILDAFSYADQECGFDQVIQQLGYPPTGVAHISGNPEGENFQRRTYSKINKRQDPCFHQNPNTPALINESINAACYGGCATWSTAQDYLKNKFLCFNIYNIGYNCQNTPDTTKFANWLNLPATKATIHAPNKNYQNCNATIEYTLEAETVEPPTYSILPSILEAGIEVHLYSGDYDFIIDHVGTELVVQNMTWGGKQGFQNPPNREFTVNEQTVGNWGAERGLSYHRLYAAGHTVPYDVPANAFAFIRDFVLSSTGYLNGQ